ncbi:hypothetical protein UlMin_038121 [Ulmus minor]
MRARISLLFFFPSPSRLQSHSSNPNTSFVSFFSSLSSPAKFPYSNAAIVDYLMNTFKLTKNQALSISNRFSWIKTTARPQLVHKFFLEIGFSETQIQSAVRVSPQILFSDVTKILRPKIEFFQQLGIVDSHLGKLISHNSTLLTSSLQKKLVPCVEILKKILGNDKNNKDLIRVLGKFNGFMWANPQKLLENSSFLASCGIVAPQLSALLKRQPVIFLMEESKLRDLVSRVSEMGLPVDTPAFVHGLETVSSLSTDTIKKKLDLLRSLGFSEHECLQMFRRQPVLLRTSEKKLKTGIDFFLNTAKFRKSMLIYAPWCLMLSIENRVVPRFKVFEVLKLKKLFKKEPSFYSMVVCSEDEFLAKYILKFGDDVEELMAAYKI